MKNDAVNTWYCTVAVATLWTLPECVREIDVAATENPVRLAKWLEKITFEQRLGLYEGNRIQTQLLYGEPVIVEEIKDEWAKVVAVWQVSNKNGRGYLGWVPLVQLKKGQRVLAKGCARVTAVKAQLWHADGSPSIVIPFNSILPYSGESGEFLTVCTPDGEGLLLKRDVELAPSINQFSVAPVSEAVDKGLQFLGLPYLWGGTSSYGYDCSGFTYNMLKACGYFIPRDACDQVLGGKEVSLSEVASWKKGDLLFFCDAQKVVRHVGFYFGNGTLLHSPSTGKSVELIKLRDLGLDYELCAVRRYG